MPEAPVDAGSVIAADRAGPLLDLPRFSGPLDLLLSLVEQRRLPITEISLAQVADQYLGYLQGLDEPDRELLARFVSIGGRLLLLKSRLLLPRETSRLVDEGESADDLVQALEEFRVIRRAAEWIEIRSQSPSFPRGLLEPGEAPAPRLAGPRPKELEAALRRILARREAPATVQLELALRVRITVAARIGDLRDVLRSKAVIDWADIAGDTVDSIVATFLAVLELIRRGEISIEQEDTFGPIQILALVAASETVAPDQADAEYQ